MPTEKEWIAEAERYEDEYEMAVKAGDHVMVEAHKKKALACRHNACYGTVDE